MKILLVNDYGSRTGGAEIQTLLLRNALRARGHDARLFASTACPGGSPSHADYHCFGTTSRFRTLLQTANPFAYWKLRRVLANFQPDVVHVKIFLTQLSPLILPLLRKRSSVYHVAWYRPLCPLGTKMLPDGSPCQVPWGHACRAAGCLPLRDWVPLMLQMRLFERWKNAFDLFLAVSGAVESQLAQAGFSPISRLTYGIPSPGSGGALTREPLAVFAGRLVKEKGVELLLRAFAEVVEQIPNAKLLVAGDGPERDRLHRLQSELGLEHHVEMSGYLESAELERRFRGAWVQVVPSRWAEPFGLVAAEALMRGTAVIATGTGGLGEIVASSGVLVPAGDAAALGGAMLRLLGDRDLACRLGRVGYEFARREFDVDTYVERLLTLYNHLARTTRER